MPDDLAPFFESRETRIRRLPEEVGQQLAAIADPVEQDKQFASLWIARRMGVPRSDVLANFDGISRTLYGPDATPASVYDAISATYQRPKAPEAGNGATPGHSVAQATAVDVSGLPVMPPEGFQVARTLGAGFQETALQLPTGFYSQLAAVTAVKFVAAPERNPEWVKLQWEKQALEQPDAIDAAITEGFSDEEKRLFKQVRREMRGELDARLKEINTRLAEIGNASSVAAVEATARWKNETDFGAVSQEYRRLADFWDGLSKETDQRWQLDPAFQATTLGGITRSLGAAPVYAVLAGLGPGGTIGLESVMFAQQEEEAKAQAAKEGREYDAQDAFATNLAATIPQLILERSLGVERLLNDVLAVTAKQGGKVVFGDLVRNFFRRAAISGAEEGITEPVQNMWGEFVNQNQTIPDLLTPEFAKRRLLESFSAFSVGFIMGGGISAVDDAGAIARANRQTTRFLKAKDGQPLTPAEFTWLRDLQTDADLARISPDEESARLLIGAVNGDEQAMVDYNTKLRNAEFVDVGEAVADGIQVGEVSGVPVLRDAEGNVTALNLADPEHQAFLEEWSTQAAQLETAAAEEEAVTLQQPADEQTANLRDLPEGTTVEDLGERFPMLEGVGQKAPHYLVRLPGDAKGEVLTPEALANRGFNPPTILQQISDSGQTYGSEAKARFPEAYQGPQMEVISSEQVPIVIREADGTEVPGLFNGYYGPGILSVARLTPQGWSHGAIMEGREGGAIVTTPVPAPAVEAQQPGDRIETGQNPQAPAQRVNVPAELRRIQKRQAAGKDVAVDLARLMEKLQKRQERQASNKAVDRTRGADWLRERLLRARRTGELTEAHVEFALWLIDQNPGLVDTVALSLPTGNEATAAGTYNPLASLITIFTSRAKDDTAVHEILHHAERLMPKDVQDAIRKEWSKQLEAELADASPERQAALGAQLLLYSGNSSYQSQVDEARKAGHLTGADYQFANPSEYWAVNGTRLLKERQQNTGWLAKARRWLQGFINRVRDIFGLTNESAILKGLQGVLDGTYQGDPEAGAKMLQQGMAAFMDPGDTDPIGPPRSELQARADRIRAKMLDARGDLNARIARGESLPKKVDRASRNADISRVAYLAMPVASRLTGFNAALGARMRGFELKLYLTTARDLHIVGQYVKAAKRLKGGDMERLDLALRNGDRETIDAINGTHGLTAQYNAAVQTFATLRARLVSTGMEIGEIANYWPRLILDLDSLMMHYHGTPAAGIIEEAIKQAQAKATERAKNEAEALVVAEAKAKKRTPDPKNIKEARDKADRKLTDEERKAVVGSALRGYRPKIDKRPGNVKERTNAVVDVEASKYYADFGNAALSYIERMNEAVAVREFFGAHLKTDTQAETTGEASPKLDLDATIQAYVLDLIDKGELDAKGQRNVIDALNARFTYQKTGGFVATMRSLGHIAALGQITSTITQLGDWQFAMYEAGFFDTLVGTAQALTGTSKVTRKQLGLDAIAEEFTDPHFWSRATNLIFKSTGMHYVITTGQQSLINASIRAMERQARSGRFSRRVQKRLAAIFTDPAEYAQAVAELREGKTTENTALLAWNVLSDWNPISLSEMPEGYLRHPNGRIFYALKTFDMKRFDAYRRESIDLFTKGTSVADKARGSRNLLHLAGLFLLAGASVDWLKAWIIGRETTLSNEVWNNVWKLFALNRYSLSRHVRNDAGVVERIAGAVENLPSATVEWVMPPLSWLTIPFDDLGRITGKMDRGEPVTFDDFESIRLLPLFGSTIYYRTGRGEERQRKRGGNSRSRVSF